MRRDRPGKITYPPGRPTIQQMLDFVSNPESGPLLDTYHQKILAVWQPCKTRIAINWDQHYDTRQHFIKFLELYANEKHIGWWEEAINSDTPTTKEDRP